MDKYIQEYKQNGITVIPGVFTKEEMKRLKEEAYTITPKQIKDGGYPHRPFEFSGSKPALVFFPSLANDYANKIRTDKRMVDIVRAFIGDNVKQVNNQIYFREAGDEDQFAWHQDIVFREPRDRFPGVVDGYLQAIICVDDMTVDNGAIEFIDGSHKHGEQEITSSSKVTMMLRHFKRMGMYGKKYEAKAGDVLLWHVLTIHGSEANISDKDRMTYMCGFCKAENCLDYPWYLQNGALQELDPTLIP